MNKKHLALASFSILTICFSGLVGISGGYIGYKLADNKGADNIQELLTQDVKVVNEESAIIDVAEAATPSVVSIVITQDVPIYENYRYNPFDDDWFSFPRRRQIGTEEQQIGAGTGFIVSRDGLIITNRHVVDEDDASYTVIFSDGSKQKATVLARDTLLDIAFLDIEGDNYAPLPLGTSSNLKVGQRVIAIGNSLGEFGNTVSSGIISGLSRSIVAGDRLGGNRELLDDVIQTDASINFGNSGGPLLDIQGNVIGVNVAVAGNAENIGFAIPIDVVKELLQRLQEKGNIDRPILGVRYVLVNENIKEELELEVDYGALLQSGSKNEPAVLPNSPADIAGLKENDIILEVDGIKINSENPLQNIIQEHEIGDTISIKFLRDGSEQTVSVILNQKAT